MADHRTIGPIKFLSLAEKKQDKTINPEKSQSNKKKENEYDKQGITFGAC